MGAWANIWKGVKIALGIAQGLQATGAVRINELEGAGKIIEGIDKAAKGDAAGGQGAIIEGASDIIKTTKRK